MSLKVPKIENTIDGSDFVRQLIEANQTRPIYSIRWFCKQLKWPPSYINDVLAKRRQLSLKRALELSKFLRLDVFETEQLILMTLASTKDQGVASFFFQELEKSRGRSSEKKGDVARFADVDVILIYMRLANEGVRIPSESMLESQIFLGHKTVEDVDNIVSWLSNEGFLTISADGKVGVGERNLHLGFSTDEEAAAILRSHVQLASIYLDQLNKEKAHFKSTFLTLSPNDYDILKGRIDRTRELADQLSDRAGDDEKRVYAYLTSIFPVSD